MRTLLIDNYDSSTFNLFHLLGEINGEEPIVVRNDELAWDELARLAPDNVVISPGPGRPSARANAGVSPPKGPAVTAIVRLTTSREAGPAN